MKTNSSFLRIVAILLASATFGIAQTSGYYNNQTIPAPSSVTPGSLNYVEGRVSSEGRNLNSQSVGHFALQPGERLSTGDGYAEMLLTPGTFLRIGPSSEFEMTSAGLADTRLNFIRGSALMEVDQIIEGTHLSASVGDSSADVLKKGLYSFDSEHQIIRVLDGKLKITNRAGAREFGKHDQISLAQGDNLKKTDFDERQAKVEPLYVWSEARSRQESGQNQLAAENSAGYAAAGYGWYWSHHSNYYGFWPASASLYSPFGFELYGGYYPGFYGTGLYGTGFYGPRLYRGSYRAYPGIRYGRPSGFHANVGGAYTHAPGGFRSGGHR